MIVNIRNLFCYLVAKSLFVSGSVKKAKERALNTKCILSVYFHKPSKQEFERCIKWFRKNKFKFISIAAARCQQLQRGARPRVESRSRKPTTVAQEEVRQGLVVAREPEVVEAPAQTSEVATHTEGTDVE